MTLRLKTVQNFMHRMNPCDLRPYYAEDCTECMNKFCKTNKTDREEYRRKKQHLHVLQLAVGKAKGDLLDQARKDPKSIYMEIHADTINRLEKEIEIT
jgi:hypothetical protein